MNEQSSVVIVSGLLLLAACESSKEEKLCAATYHEGTFVERVQDNKKLPVFGTQIWRNKCTDLVRFDNGEKHWINEWELKP